MFRVIAVVASVLAPCFVQAASEESRAQPELATAPPLVSSRASLTLEGARAVVRAAMDRAHALGTTGAIAVVDVTGNVVVLERLDQTFPVAARVAAGKASTAAAFGFPTANFETSIRDGRTPLLDLADTLQDFTPLKGGVPIRIGGQVVGAIGVSGAASADQDEELALAGARALDVVPSQSSSK
jgi:glc operon protein GlcG